MSSEWIMTSLSLALALSRSLHVASVASSFHTLALGTTRPIPHAEQHGGQVQLGLTHPQRCTHLVVTRTTHKHVQPARELGIAVVNAFWLKRSVSAKKRLSADEPVSVWSMGWQASACNCN
jgi:hypothetical protein